MNEGLFDKATATRRALLLGLAATATAPLIGCARSDDGPKLVTADGVKRAQPPANAPVSTSAAGLSAFGHRLVQAAAKPGENFVVSPVSIAIAFAMARVGAAGTTAEQIDAAFGFPANGRDEAFNAITSRLVTADVPPKPDGKERKADGKKLVPVVSLGNALFPQKGFPIGQAFLKTLAEQYAAGVRPVDFGSGDAAKKINAWVDQQTAGRIKQLFDHLDGATRLVLANTVYFKADWQSIFAGAAAAPFTKADGTAIQTPTMRDTLKVRYAETAGVQAVELPYAGGPYAMWLMLPSPGGKPEDALNPAVFGKLSSGLAERTVEVSVPRWDFASTIDLKAVLGGLGVTAAFGPGADFGGIAPDLYIDQAVHKANITVDEWGTEAAAVTGISFAVSGPPPADAKFLADRPFAFAIVGGDDHIPLFIGRVTDPSAK